MEEQVSGHVKYKRVEKTGDLDYLGPGDVVVDSEGDFGVKNSDGRTWRVTGISEDVEAEFFHLPGLAFSMTVAHV